MIQSQPRVGARENPFRISRLNDSSDFRTEWDVAALNETQSSWILREIRRVGGRATPDPGQLIPILVSMPGYGKTHMLGRIEHAVGTDAFFVFVGQIPDPTRMLDHVRWAVTEALFRKNEQETTPLREALASLLVPSLQKHADKIQDPLKRAEVKEKLRHGTGGAVEILCSSKSAASFHRLAISMSSSLPHVRSSIIRAFVMSLSAEAHLARQWLRGEKLTDQERQRVGVLDETPGALDLMTAVAAVFDYKKPMVLCFDQIDAIMDDSEALDRLTRHLMEILTAVPCQFSILSCLGLVEAEKFSEVLPPAFRRRANVLKLDFPRPEHGLALVKRRLQTWEAYDAKRGEYWPFDAGSIENFARTKRPRADQLIELCRIAIDPWLEGRLKAPVYISADAATPQISKEELFRKRWQEELATVQKDPRRQIEELSDARVYVGVKELIGMLQAAGKDGPIPINLVKDDVLSSASSYKRYGMRIELNEGAGKYSIIIGVTTLTGGNPLFYYVREFDRALKTARGGIILQPRREFCLGQVGNNLVKKGSDAGKLQILPIAKHRDMFVAMECAVGLLEQARSGALVLGTETIDLQQCQILMRETGVLDGMTLFQTLQKWIKAPAKPATSKRMEPEPPVAELEEAPELVPS